MLEIQPYPPRRWTRILAVLALAASCASAEPAATLPSASDVSRSPGKRWNKMDNRLLTDLPTIPTDPPGGLYGGAPDAVTRATGFFRAAKSNTDGRWWLIDPDGHLFIHRGVTSVSRIPTSGAEKSLRETFGSTDAWADSTAKLLKDHGFNGLGAWCDDGEIRPARQRLVYTKLWNFMSSYGRKRGGTFQKSGHIGYPGDCPFIFDPGFPEFCDQHAAQLAATRDDPWLLGHFTDNELPWSRDMLGNYLSLPDSDPGNIAARKWLADRRTQIKDITPKDRDDFVAFAADTYFNIVCTAIRRHDPNHLILGSRFHGGALRIPSLFEAAGRHLDVIGVNYYRAWTPDRELLASWSQRSGKPVIITEWYAKGADSGMANTSGAGWLVRTQADRAAFYQNFTLALIESRVCVGWHWFRYSDNDPDRKGADPSNVDANKGIVSNRYVPYQPLLDGMRDINTRTFGIIEHFDRSSTSSGK